jgi:hypothetical protein
VRPAPQRVARSNLRRRLEVKQEVPPRAGPSEGT